MSHNTPGRMQPLRGCHGNHSAVLSLKGWAKPKCHHWGATLTDLSGKGKGALAQPHTSPKPPNCTSTLRIIFLWLEPLLDLAEDLGTQQGQNCWSGWGLCQRHFAPNSLSSFPHKLKDTEAVCVLGLSLSTGVHSLLSHIMAPSVLL